MDQYYNAVRGFYALSDKYACPDCKGGHVVKEVFPDKYVVKCSKKDCKWEVEIHMPQEGELHAEELELRQHRAELVSEIIKSLDTLTDSKFKELKKEIAEIDVEMKEIRTIRDGHEKSEAKMSAEIFDVFSQLVELYYKRKEIYKNVEPISGGGLRTVFQIFQKEGMIKGARLKAVADDVGATAEQLKTILEWVAVCTEYAKLQAELDKYNQEYQRLRREVLNVVSREPRVVNPKGLEHEFHLYKPPKSETKKDKSEIVPEDVEPEKEEDKKQEAESEEVEKPLPVRKGRREKKKGAILDVPPPAPPNGAKPVPAPESEEGPGIPEPTHKEELPDPDNQAGGAPESNVKMIVVKKTMTPEEQLATQQAEQQAHQEEIAEMIENKTGGGEIVIDI